MPIDIDLIETGSIFISPDPKEDPLYYIDLGDGTSCKLSIPQLLMDFVIHRVPTLWFFHDAGTKQLQLAWKKETFGDKEPIGYITRDKLLEIAARLLRCANWPEEDVDGKVIE